MPNPNYKFKSKSRRSKNSSTLNSFRAQRSRNWRIRNCNRDESGWSAETIRRQFGNLVPAQHVEIEEEENWDGEVGYGACCWHMCGSQRWVWCCGGLCWEWYHYGDEGCGEVEVKVEVDTVGEVREEREVEEMLEILCLREESEGGVLVGRAKGEEKVERKGKWRDEWECDFCGKECFCKYQKFSESGRIGRS
jgi:hypothetical protein